MTAPHYVDLHNNGLTAGYSCCLGREVNMVLCDSVETYYARTGLVTLI